MSTSNSRILAPTPTLIEKSWYLLTILIRLGRPARPSELASRFTLDSTSISPDLVEFLCRIPGSPLFLTDGDFVTVSETAIAALGDLLAGSIATFVPRFGIRASEPRNDRRVFKLMYTRKRKVGPSGIGLLESRTRRRLFLASKDGDDLGEYDGLRIRSSPEKVSELQINVADIQEKDRIPVGTSSMVSNQDITLTPSLNYPIGLLSKFGLRNSDLERRDSGSEKMCNTRQGINLHKELTKLPGYDYGSLDVELNDAISESITTTRFGMCEAHTEPAFVGMTKDNTLLWMETMGEDSCIVAAAPVAVRYEDIAGRNFLKAKNESNVSSVDNGILIGHKAGLEESRVATEANCCQNEGASSSARAFRRAPEESSLIVQARSKLESSAVSLLVGPATVVEQQTRSLDEPKFNDGIVSILGLQNSPMEFKYRTSDIFPTLEQAKRGEKVTSAKPNMKRAYNIDISPKENRKEAASKVSKSKSEPKLLPNFESFVIEEEEGSGGYGIVYRGRRKEDGKVFAVKCPHPNAHSHHVHNELKMLERFGGRNFVIKYEGSLRNGHSECFVLEHVEHDRPEVLKKEIDVFGLQWYGYCMFRALASLHKQGIVHRDVKPGNFLFSRKLNKGYLIDFNLASDLHQKFSKNSKSGTSSNMNLDTISLSSSKSASLTQARKLCNDGIVNNSSKEAANGSRKLVFKNMKRSGRGHGDTFPSIDSSSKFGSQAADSGVTSAKDPTSTRTRSGDRLKQPMPYKGRKELINFVHEAMQIPNQKTPGPTSQRKRVAAPLGKINRRLVMLTPMPLHSGGDAVAGAGMFNKGNGKARREGPCVGTKGFRAPEVLFKSCHQGCKIDVWSAGVTLLYLIMGKAPFGGDPEQNIKEIAKLRGSEDLWEVAKLHDRESSYPVDLFDVQSLESMNLIDWCSINTKRPEFLKQVPVSLFDLMDRCLTVNPRRRITAEEALMHDFFAPCHESLRKQRLLRRVASSECGSQTL